jgi:hypothetical protein
VYPRLVCPLPIPLANLIICKLHPGVYQKLHQSSSSDTMCNRNANCFPNCVVSGEGSTNALTQPTAAESEVEDPGFVRKVSLKEQMDAVLKQSMQLHQASTLGSSASSVKKSLDKAVAAAIKTEMAVFESSGVIGRSLELVYNYLLSIPPAAVESERILGLWFDMFQDPFATG